jgi:hypothetical protein
MSTPKIKYFILQHSDLFWYLRKDKNEDMNNELLVETILNYVDKEAFIQLTDLKGINNEANSFFNSINISNDEKVIILK